MYKYNNVIYIQIRDMYMLQYNMYVCMYVCIRRGVLLFAQTSLGRIVRGAPFPSGFGGGLYEYIPLIILVDFGF